MDYEWMKLLASSGALRAAEETGLLQRVLRAPATAEELAADLSLDRRALERVLAVLVSYHVLVRDGATYAASSELRFTHESMPGAVDMTLMLFRHTPEMLRTGEPIRRMDGSVAEREESYRAAGKRLGRMFEGHARALAGAWSREVETILDIGCGSGVWSLAFAERNPTTLVTGLDLPAVLPAFEERARDLGLTDRTTTLAGDMHEIDYARHAFDMVIIANVIHLEPPERVESLLSKASRAVRPGGELVIVDTFVDASNEHDPNLTTYELGLALRTTKGRVYRADDVEGWLRRAGLVTDFVPLPGFAGSGALRGRHPVASADELRGYREKLQTLEKRFRYLFDEAPDPIAIVSHHNARVLHVNPAFQRLLGPLPTQRWAHWSDYVHTDDRDRVHRVLEAHVAGVPAPPRYPVRLVALDATDGAEPISAELTLHPPDERVTAVLIRDVTESMRAARELRDAQAKLLQQAKVASLGTLVAGVAHELNSPLGSILSNVDLSARALAILRAEMASPTDRAKTALDALMNATAVTRSAGERTNTIVRSLRSFARLDEAEVKKVDLHEGIDSALTLLAHVLGDRVAVERRYGELPALVCRPSQINEVFMSLLTNAIEAIDGSGTLTITTGVDGDRAMVRIADTGRGIPAAHLERIFDPGFTTKGVGVGTGLGLAIAYRVVGEHDGSIDVESTPGCGSAFTVRLPLER
ncbi:MAG: methyltransferase domain-containing protein [Deltaproteobacteria bacterium]|nr:methyltransferase domain-containing protein [Deltaproteobacteria bacterium]